MFLFTFFRYFDVSWLSQYPEEEEKLFIGSSLEIIDIIIDCNWKGSDNYISAIHMFENIINGQFINEKRIEAQEKLLILIQNAIKAHRGKGRVTDTPPNYFLALFMNLIRKMQEKNITNSLWINIHDLEKIKNQKLKKSLSRYGDFFDCFGVNIENINSVRQYKWDIKDVQYKKLASHNIGEHIKSGEIIIYPIKKT